MARARRPGVMIREQCYRCYDGPHRKTQEVSEILKNKAVYTVTFENREIPGHDSAGRVAPIRPA